MSFFFFSNYVNRKFLIVISIKISFNCRSIIYKKKKMKLKPIKVLRLKNNCVYQNSGTKKILFFKIKIFFF